MEKHSISPEKVTTVHLAADPIFHPENRQRIDSTKVLTKYGLKQDEFLLFPGNTWPHKNHRTLFLALRTLREDYGLEPLLVCTGAPKDAQADLQDQIQHLGLGNQIRFLGYCPKPDMPALYESAAALVFPSVFEGFGLPLVEAMWCECPIACSNLTSLPEIADDAALFFDPYSPEEMALSISRLLTDSQLRKELIARGSSRASTFSWRKFTTDMIRILRQVWEERGF
jgi:glycosyltransferase involved in cell wall biosynthesis